MDITLESFLFAFGLTVFLASQASWSIFHWMNAYPLRENTANITFPYLGWFSV